MPVSATVCSVVAAVCSLVGCSYPPDEYLHFTTWGLYSVRRRYISEAVDQPFRAYFIGCYAGMGKMVIVPAGGNGLVLPLDDWPEEASRPSLWATEIVINKFCVSSLFTGNIITRDSGSLMLYGAADILRAIDVSPNGTLSVADRRTCEFHTRDWHYYIDFDGGTAEYWTVTHRPILWVPMQERGRDGSIQFNRVGSGVRMDDLAESRTEVFDSKPVPGSDRCERIVARKTSPESPVIFVSLEEDTCCICVAQVAMPADRARIGCRHWFHGPCLEQWLRQPGVRRACPMCRQRITL